MPEDRSAPASPQWPQPPQVSSPPSPPAQSSMPFATSPQAPPPSSSPPHVKVASSAGIDRGGLDIGRCFNDAIDAYKANFWQLFAASVLFWVLSLVSLLILAGPMWGGICIMSVAILTGEDKRADVGKLFAGFHRFFPLLGLFLITTLAELAGLALFILPGLLIATLWLFPAFLMMDKGIGIFEALGMSKRTVMRHGFGANFGLMLLILVICIVPQFIPYLGWVIGWFTAPMAWLMNASAYVQEVREAPLPHADNGAAPARCGRCGYLLRGVSTFNCPECGADLREVGMIPSQ